MFPSSLTVVVEFHEDCSETPLQTIFSNVSPNDVVLHELTISISDS